MNFELGNYKCYFYDELRHELRSRWLAVMYALSKITFEVLSLNTLTSYWSEFECRKRIVSGWFLELKIERRDEFCGRRNRPRSRIVLKQMTHARKKGTGFRKYIEVVYLSNQTRKNNGPHNTLNESTKHDKIFQCCCCCLQLSIGNMQRGFNGFEVEC